MWAEMIYFMNTFSRFTTRLLQNSNIYHYSQVTSSISLETRSGSAPGRSILFRTCNKVQLFKFLSLRFIQIHFISVQKQNTTQWISKTQSNRNFPTEDEEGSHQTYIYFQTAIQPFEFNHQRNKYRTKPILGNGNMVRNP